MRHVRWAALGCFAATGCLGLDEPGSESFFRRAQPAGPPPNVTPASTEAAARVDALGRRIVAVNRQAGVDTRSLMFHTIGAPQPEVFHRGTSDIYITEGLVRQCATDGQLAAVLCTELGRLVSEREALAPPSVRKPERLPPIDTGIGNDAGWSTAPDQTRLRELADYDRERRQQHTPLPPPDPQALARVYLLRAGYHDDDLAAAAALLQSARGYSGFEKQISAPQ
jgi:predicted Zn-dependent protease